MQYLLKNFEEFPQNPEIQENALELFCAYNRQFSPLVFDEPKIAVACLAVARSWFLDSEEQCWPEEYATKIGLDFVEFKSAYEQVYCLAQTVLPQPPLAITLISSQLAHNNVISTTNLHILSTP